MSDRKSLSWKQIVSFNAAAQLGSFSRAATLSRRDTTGDHRAGDCY